MGHRVRSLLLMRRYLSLLMGVLSIGLALGWGKYVGHLVYLPQFDYVDVALGTSVGAYLILIWISDARHPRRAVG